MMPRRFEGFRGTPEATYEEVVNSLMTREGISEEEAVDKALALGLLVEDSQGNLVPRKFGKTSRWTGKFGGGQGRLLEGLEEEGY